MWSTRAFLISLGLAGLLALPIYYYWNFLTKGSQAPEATLILNKMEAEGVPDFSIKDLKGDAYRLSDLKGKIIVLNFWASWCAPCVKEFPSLKRLSDHFKGQVVVVAVSHDNSRDDLDSFMQSFGGQTTSFSVYWDQDRSIGKLYGVRVLPETFIIGRDLKLIRKVSGDEEWDHPMTLEFFEAQLKK